MSGFTRERGAAVLFHSQKVAPPEFWLGIYVTACRPQSPCVMPSAKTTQGVILHEENNSSEVYRAKTEQGQWRDCFPFCLWALFS